MSDSTDRNPYAPSLVPANQQPAQLATPARQVAVGSIALCLWTIAACTIAGALFGLSVLLVVMLASVFTSGVSIDEWSAIFEGVVFIVYALIAGGILALVSSVPSVSLVFIAGIPGRKVDHRWDRGGVFRFATLSGLLSGFLPITIVSGFDLGGILFSVIPAVFGGLVARVVITPLARKAGETTEPLPGEPPDDDRSNPLVA